MLGSATGVFDQRVESLETASVPRVSKNIGSLVTGVSEKIGSPAGSGVSLHKGSPVIHVQLNSPPLAAKVMQISEKLQNLSLNNMKKIEVQESQGTESLASRKI